MVASTSRTKEGALRIRRLTSFSSGSVGRSVLSILRMEFWKLCRNDLEGYSKYAEADSALTLVLSSSSGFSKVFSVLKKFRDPGCLTDAF